MSRKSSKGKTINSWKIVIEVVQKCEGKKYSIKVVIAGSLTQILKSKKIAKVKQLAAYDSMCEDIFSVYLNKVNNDNRFISI